MRLRPIGLALVLFTAHAAWGDTLPARQPGLWQSVTNVTTAAGQPLPHGSGIVSVNCVDAATDVKFFLTGGSHCADLSINGQGNTYTIDGTCQDFSKTTNINETLVYAGNQSVTLSADVDSANGPLKVTSQLTYQGACLPGMAPGDEGSIVNGSFDKADNIDDSDNQ